MRSNSGPALAFALAVVCVCACKLEPPPAIPELEAAADKADGPTDDPAPEGTPDEETRDEASPPSYDGAGDGSGGEPKEPSNLEALMAAPACEVVVDSVLKSGRAFWSGVGKYTCTYRIIVNGSSYKYTRMVPRDRKREPIDVCEDGIKSMESVVRTATRECRDLQATDRRGEGLRPVR